MKLRFTKHYLDGKKSSETTVGFYKNAHHFKVSNNMLPKQIGNERSLSSAGILQGCY